MDKPQNILATSNNDALLNQDQYNSRIAQFLENPNVSKRIKMEINELLIANNKNFIFDIYSTESTAHPCEVKFFLYDNESDVTRTVEHILTCKIPMDYPFKAPMLFMETKNDLLTKKLIAIQNSLKDHLARIWSPARKIHEIIDMAHEKIRSYEKQAHATAQGKVRTVNYLKEKYQNFPVDSNGKYPELQQKLQGLWVKEISTGYLVFQVQGDYISITFESIDIDTNPISYKGSYAAGYYISDKNKFDIHISDENDLRRINHFQLRRYPDFISLQFVYFADGSILNSIIEPLEMNYCIGESINFKKIE